MGSMGGMGGKKIIFYSDFTWFFKDMDQDMDQDTDQAMEDLVNKVVTVQSYYLCSLILILWKGQGQHPLLVVRVEAIQLLGLTSLVTSLIQREI